MGIAYTVVAWLLLQVADVVMENIGAPDWVMQALLFLLLLGLLPALIFAWVFELTPEGIKRESEIAEGVSVVHQTRRKLDTLIIVTLVVAVAYLFWEGRLREPSTDAPTTAFEQGAGGEQKLTGMDALREQTEIAARVKNSADADGKTSIAVLPFVNLSSDPEQEYFSDGISEELLNVLAQIPALRVAARTSSFQFKGDNRDIGEIADLLKVGHVLEGSVRKAGTRLRITAQLIEAEDGFHLWSETYDRELEDVFAIQDDISKAIADALTAELGLKAELSPGASKATANTAAYEAFLKGRALVNQRGNQAITAGVRELERAVRLDPNYAPARAQLAIGITLLAASTGTYGDLTIDEVNERAGEQIAAAEKLDDDFAELWAARAILARVNFDPRSYLKYSEQALAIRPNYADALNWRVNALNGLGLAEQAVQAREELL
ncbi:TPR repeat-containing protein [gamma proteobacterium NOR5-3]|nr:TPR repeat-containing protein [gamma proteobacterium NOR5-3]